MAPLLFLGYSGSSPIKSASLSPVRRASSVCLTRTITSHCAPSYSTLKVAGISPEPHTKWTSCFASVSFGPRYQNLRVCCHECLLWNLDFDGQQHELLLRLPPPTLPLASLAFACFPSVPAWNPNAYSSDVVFTSGRSSGVSLSGLVAMNRLDADWIVEGGVIPLLGINERRSGNAETLQKGIRYFQINFGSVGADAGHDGIPYRQL